jgi:hypothetical protein
VVLALLRPIARLMGYRPFELEAVNPAVERSLRPKESA